MRTRRIVRSAWILVLGAMTLGLGHGVAMAAAPSALVDPKTTPATLDELAADINTYRQHINTLANPFFEGRAPGTDGIQRAADYIEFHFKRHNLEPAFTGSGDDAPRTYRQPFQAPDSLRPGDTLKVRMQALSYTIAGAPGPALKPERDFSVIGYSGSATVSGPLVFVGYGIEKGREDYTSFPKDLDLSGSIALLMRFEPMNDEGKSRWANRGWSPSSTLEEKLKAVASRKPAAIILVNPPGVADARVGKLEGLELRGRRPIDVPVVMASPESIDALLAGATSGDTTLLKLRQTADEGTSTATFGNVSVSVDVTLDRVKLMSDNMGGILRGRGTLADEYIVIGSHYDHVGYGYFGSRDSRGRGVLHPGADDNGSGTSGMLTLVGKLAAAYADLPADANVRSILFLGFSAEESGLNGSRFYCENPPFPLAKHYLMINMDMIGRLRDKPPMELGGVGTAEGLKEWLAPYVDNAGFKIAQKNSGFGPSDHASFTAVKVPALFFFTGLHDEYHMPTDVASLINVEGAAKVCDLVYRVALGAAMRPEALVWTSGARREREPAETAPAEAPTAQAPQDQPGPSPLGGVSVRFGISPGDYSGEEPGVLVGEVLENLPAAKAGLLKGDLMVSWNGTKLERVEDWMPLLRAHKPGDKVTIIVKRDGRDVTLEATLTGRQQQNQ
ncbi:MAG: M28 family peptidase [Phycisphaerales bacterium]|nr:M28 family peptidase [Phycisphaerales bacterium]